MPAYKIISSIPASIFRAYDIRGIVGDTLTPDIVYTIGLAVGNKVREAGGNNVALGRDGRFSGPSFLDAMAQGLVDSGCDVIAVDQVPTPLLYYATKIFCKSGTMITGSHNPPEYNGIKIVIEGETIFGEQVQDLYRAIVGGNLTKAKKAGTLIHKEIIESYIKRVTDDVKLQKKLKIVIDCGNGVGGEVAPQLFRKLGCEVECLFCEVDGRFPNHHPDPSIVSNLNDLIKAVKESGADVGLAFDGDADRLGLVTNKGEIILPDRIVMYFALDLLTRYLGSPIPFDVKCTRHLGDQIREHGGTPLMIATGHSILKAKMEETHALLGGELSGHIFLKERWYGFDDGLYVAARLLELISKDKRSISEIFAALPNSINTPEIKIALSEEKKAGFMEKLIAAGKKIKGAKIITIDGLRIEFKDGFGLARSSNTTPFLTVRFEGDSEAALEKIKKIFRELLLSIDPELSFEF